MRSGTLAVKVLAQVTANLQLLTQLRQPIYPQEARLPAERGASHRTAAPSCRTAAQARAGLQPRVRATTAADFP